MLEINQEIRDSVQVWRLMGRLDGSGALVFNQKAQTLTASVRHVILDFAGLSYLSSVGIRSLILLERALKAHGGSTILCGVPPVVAQVLDLAGLPACFHQASDAEEAALHHEMLTEAMDSLNERERHILVERRLTDNPKTLEELSQVYDVSRERIRQIEVRAFEKLQKAMFRLAGEKLLAPA